MRDRQANEGVIEQGIRPFSNGFEYEAWDEVNCCRCGRQPWVRCANGGGFEGACEIFAAVTEGIMPHDLAERMGYFDEQTRSGDLLPQLGWRCKEWCKEPPEEQMRMFEEPTP